VTSVIAIPESLTQETTRLEEALADIAMKETELVTQRKNLQAALNRIAGAVAVLSGQAHVGTVSTARKPMSQEARKKISEALKKAAASKKAQGTVAEPAKSAAVPDATAKAAEVAPPGVPTPTPTSVEAPPRIVPVAAAANIYSGAEKRGRADAAAMPKKAAAVAPKAQSHGKGASVPRRGTKGN